ncbi:MAG: hypothetical protein SGI83_01645 [Bacteroidota bacterium]|nr:hypothetical protein [Bacteroidota bacterium]
MKKFVIILLAAGLFTACKDDKAPKEKYNRDKDDYRSSDKEGGDKEKTSTDYQQDKEKTGTQDEKPDNVSTGDVTERMDNSSGGGWPQIERTAFIKSCEREAIASGTTRLVAQSYCQCMLDKMESTYPDIKVAVKLTMEQVQQFGTKHREACLEEH